MRWHTSGAVFAAKDDLSPIKRSIDNGASWPNAAFTGRIYQGLSQIT